MNQIDHLGGMNKIADYPGLRNYLILLLVHGQVNALMIEIHLAIWYLLAPKLFFFFFFLFLEENML